jgi:pimeloyl-ACP methyl ester carboxylesterase
MGPLSLGYYEVDEVVDALDYLVTREDVDPDRVGIYGFSSAGATAVMAAARLPDFRAVVAEGGYGSFVENALGRDRGHHLLHAYFLTLFRWATRLTYRLVTGLDLAQLSPVTVIDQIGPRPILLIYGSREVSLPGGRRQQAVAGGNAELWIVEGAGHGNYLAVAPEAYEVRIVTFFDEALLGRVR